MCTNHVLSAPTSCDADPDRASGASGDAGDEVHPAPASVYGATRARFRGYGRNIGQVGEGKAKSKGCFPRARCETRRWAGARGAPAEVNHLQAVELSRDATRVARRSGVATKLWLMFFRSRRYGRRCV